jgi:tetratricopeptide (TPR) repeat protein
MDSTNTHFRYQLAQALNELDQKGAALMHLRAANRFSPKHHGVLHDLISIHAGLNLNDIAREYAVKSIDMSPNFIPFRKRLAEIEFKEQKYSEAANQYQEVINLGDKTQFTYRNYGMSLYFADQFGEAIKAFDASLKLGDDPNVHFYKAMALVQVGQPERAQEHLMKSVENSIGDLLIDSFIQLGSLLDKKGDLENSIKNYSIASSLAPNKIEIQFYMGSAYDRTGVHRLEAREYYRNFLNAESQRDPVMENYARSRISKLNEEIHFRGNN